MALTVAALATSGVAQAQPVVQDWHAILRRLSRTALNEYVREPDSALMIAAALTEARRRTGAGSAGFDACFAARAGKRGLVALDRALDAAFSCLAPEGTAPDIAEESAVAVASAALASLDPASRLISSVEVARLKKLLVPANRLGVGVSYSMTPAGLKVVSTIWGGPAEAAGLVAGDVITAIDDVQTVTLGMDNSAAAMRGPAGSAVVLSVLGADGKLQTFNLLRRGIPAIETMRQGDALTVRFNALTQEIPSTFTKALAAQGTDAKVLVIDLRHNPGGLLDVVVSVADALLASGPIFSQADRRNRVETRAKAGATFGDKPVVVIVDRKTESGAELIAAALADNHRALIVGEPSSGSGSVHDLIPVGGPAPLKLKTAELMRANGEPLVGHPVVPDCEVSANDPTIFAIAARIGLDGLSTCPAPVHRPE
ncbi:MAG: PDZ domain-containing protein [Novosphingobium sp.]|nr:PDZ domain-containing protein [Novosphingobium sp.]